MFFCAFLVNDSTEERKFSKIDSERDAESQQSPRLYVVQPGNQVIGDRTFDSLLLSSSKELPQREYITSWKKSTIQAFEANDESVSSRSSKGWNQFKKPSPEPQTSIATLGTVAGFVFQFLGLRPTHAAVSLLQLSFTLRMGIIRALLRTQRLRMEQNILRDRPYEVSGHELDWLALQIGEEPGQPRSFWCVATGITTELPKQASSEKESEETRLIGNEDYNQAQLAYNYRTRFADLTWQLTKNKHTPSNAWDNGLVAGRAQAQQLSQAIGRSLDILSAGLNFKPAIPERKETINWKLSILV
ncbi:hypothetical protein M426DRAFT_27960 [Hypoxylon sp. CI-4A]|nr:hypothetical protein M426DRAFT_27960 [Hypoxylon sp. CI-4A]